MKETTTFQGIVAINEMVLCNGELRRYVRLRNVYDTSGQPFPHPACAAAFFQPKEAPLAGAEPDKIASDLALRFADARPGAQVEIEVVLPLDELGLEQSWDAKQFTVIDLRKVPEFQGRPPAPGGKRNIETAQPWSGYRYGAPPPPKGRFR